MPVDAALAARAALREHLRRHFPGQVIDELPGVEGPIEERVPDFRVFRVHPNGPGGWWVYVTSGCWAATPAGRSRDGVLPRGTAR